MEVTIDILVENLILKEELKRFKIMMNELEDTNHHLVSATWRERDLKKQLLKTIEDVSNSKKRIEEQLKGELSMLRIMLQELESTNNHLVSATWRERDLKKELREALNEISKSKQLIEIQNKRIEESINYAERIQRSILTNEENILELFPKSSMVFIPRDKVSGDFPWIHKRGDNIFVSVVDCTGHGVPGALLSLIGHFILKETCNHDIITTPSQLLDHLHEGVKKTLKQEENAESRDGMDVAMCMIDLKENKLQFSGAHRNLILIRNGEIIEYKGDRRPIGGVQYNSSNLFTNFEIELQKGDTIYFYSDGLPDQIGGPEMKKIMNCKVKQILLDNNKYEMDIIKANIFNEFDKWKDKGKQIDDVLLMGIRF
ncbi:MAG TPA: SpoIIE family protein phosphatase [Cytophagaceae bacterium]|jgi:serine phosphatase RsbU (regulator of sigma subunit)|nr:SpoIIE family protein phosphatase [Cytophagaceae bacterium]